MASLGFIKVFLANCCSYFSAFLVLLWKYLMVFQNYCIRLFAVHFITTSVPFHEYLPLVTLLVFLFYPIFGLLADVSIGRYRALLIGAILSFCSWIIIGIIWMVAQLVYSSDTGPYSQVYGILFYLFQFVMSGGYASFAANIIQYNIDQIVGASAIQLSTLIYWHTACEPLFEFIYYTTECIFYDSHKINFIFAGFILSGVCISFVLAGISFTLSTQTGEHITNQESHQTDS